MSVVDFGGLTISYDDTVLQPRGWTLHQSLWGLQLLREVPEGPVLELCSGAGQIGLVVAARSARRLVCVDASPAAASYTARNAEAAGLLERVEIRLERMSQALRRRERFPLIIADPPWVRRDQTGRFPEDPLSAIDGGDDGLDLARECVTLIGRHLALGGAALLQIGSGEQVGALAASLEEAGLEVVETRDFGDRGVLVRLRRARPGPS
ncbi:MAG: ribosomal protein glutamine methyltransferase [Nocardioidaceae bacterium]|nr:ribosomal protein glutamine methyltransferase [Nocardioidaceae bacterium]